MQYLKNQNKCQKFYVEQNTKMLNKDRVPTGLGFGGGELEMLDHVKMFCNLRQG